MIYCVGHKFKLPVVQSATRIGNVLFQNLKVYGSSQGIILLPVRCHKKFASIVLFTKIAIIAHPTAFLMFHFSPLWDTEDCSELNENNAFCHPQ